MSITTSGKDRVCKYVSGITFGLRSLSKNNSEYFSSTRMDAEGCYLQYSGKPQYINQRSTTIE